MRFLVHLAHLAIGCLAGLALVAGGACAQPRAEAPALAVVEGGWGSAQPQEIDAVLRGVVAVFPQAAGQVPPPVRVRHRYGGPQINYDREGDGWLTVYLSARNDRWYQYVYQFAHEYCHLLSRFDRKEQAGEIVRDNQWFEEALCETASLYALRRLARDWCDGAGDAWRREAAAQFSRYARQLLDEPHRTPGLQATLAAWYDRHRETLRTRAYERELNEVVATELLPLFEQDAGRWAALASLRQGEAPPGQSFADFLARWAQAAPAASRSLVPSIQTLFGLRSAAEGLNAPPLPQRGTAPECGD